MLPTTLLILEVHSQSSISEGDNISDYFFSDAVNMEEMKDEEFGTRLDSGSFLAHLAADEAAVQEANKLMLVSLNYILESLPLHLSDNPSFEMKTYMYCMSSRSYSLQVLQSPLHTPPPPHNSPSPPTLPPSLSPERRNSPLVPILASAAIN